MLEPNFLDLKKPSFLDVGIYYILCLSFRPQRQLTEIIVPQYAGGVLVFTPPGTPRRTSLTGPITAKQVFENGSSTTDRNKFRQSVGSEVSVSSTDEGFEMVELTVQPFIDGMPVDNQRKAAFKKMDDVVDELLLSEQKYVEDLTALVEVRFKRAVLVKID